MTNATLQQRTSQPIMLGKVPPVAEGPRALPVMFDFTQAATLNFNANYSDVGMSIVQTMFIDNRNNLSSASFTIASSGQIIVCPPQTQAVFPVLFVGNQNIFIIGSSAGLVQVPVQLLNVYIDPMTWNANNPQVSGTVTVNGTVITQPLTGAYTNRSGSIAVANTSQQLAAANGSRRRLFIQNPYTAAGQNIGAAESIYINFTSAAVVNDGNSIEILPGASFDTGMGPVTTELVNIISATAGHRFVAREI